jgi:LysR family glycine cleavage system transcriptional activator
VYLRSRARTPKIALFKRWIEETLAGDTVSASEIDVGGR